MAKEGYKRKISAILSADVVGFSRLMGNDESATVRTLESYREIISSLIEEYDGHLVDSPGDNILTEFPSVVDAVQCAVEIQQVLKTRNTELPDDRKMEFRIGINLGDVIVEGDRLYGDGVNIAARIESLADPGGICISGSAYEQIATKLSLGYQNLGDHVLKNISRPIRVYKIPTELDEKTGTEIEQHTPAQPFSGNGMPIDSNDAGSFARKRNKDIEGYYIGGFICLACALGLPFLGYIIGLSEPGEFYAIFYSIGGSGILVGLIGITLIFFARFLDKRRKAEKR